MWKEVNEHGKENNTKGDKKDNYNEKNDKKSNTQTSLTSCWFFPSSPPAVGRGVLFSEQQ